MDQRVIGIVLLHHESGALYEVVMRLASTLSRHTPYLTWTLVSAVALVTACLTDPHIFGLAAFVAAGISGLLALAALFIAPTRFAWAAASALPTLVAFAILSTYRWA